MRDKVPWPALIFVAGIAWQSSPAFGHADPWGDLHPQVLVVDGNFVVHFTSSIPGQPDNYTGSQPVFAVVFSPEGKLLVPRHPLKANREWSSIGPAGLYGKHLVCGDTSFIFGSERSDKPGYFLKSSDGKLTRHHLPWPDTVSLDLFEDVVATADGFAITGKEDEEILKFYWFEHGADRPPKTIVIGPTYCIYNFPVASNIAFADGRFWVAFMRSAPKQDGKGQLVLWSWKPGEEKAREEILNSPVHWNCHLSLAATHDHLCLAYHCATLNEYYGGDARIFTVFKKVGF